MDALRAHGLFFGFKQKSALFHIVRIYIFFIQTMFRP